MRCVKLAFISALGLFFLLYGCSSDEEKKAARLAKGKIHFEKGNYFHLVVKEIDEEFVQKGTLQAIVKRNEWDSTEPLHKSYQSLLGR